MSDLHKRDLFVGLGCASYVVAEEAIETVGDVLAEAELQDRPVARLATIDKLLGYPAVIAVAESLRAELVGYPPAELDGVLVPTPSDYVRGQMQTKSVAEAGALLAAGHGRLLVPKQIRRKSITVAVAEAA